MRFTVIVVVLFAITMVTMANRGFKLRKRQMKKQQQECDLVSWGKCVNGKITQTVQVNASNPACTGAIVQATEIKHTMDCVKNETNQFKKCKIIKSHNFTTCQEGGESYTMTKLFECQKSHKNKVIAFQKSCSMRANSSKEMKIKKKKGAGAGKGKTRANRKEKKEFKKRRQALRAQGCDYEAADCSGKTATWTVTSTSKPECDKEIQGPCFGAMKKRKTCKYKSERWSDCDPVTNIKTKRRVLKRGDPLSCNDTMIVEKSCKRKPRPLRESKCKYKKTQWSECDPVTNEKTMIKTLLSPGTSCPPIETVKKVCKRKFKNSKKRRCAYKGVSKWGDCDRETNTRSRQMVLKKGHLKFCKPTMIATKPCKKKRKKAKKGCKYDRNQWSPCDAATNTVTRTLTLKAGDPNICNASKTITRKCKDKHLRPHLCVYRRTTWGECDGTTNTVSMMKTLKRGDPSLCDPTKTVQRKCKRKKKAEEIEDLECQTVWIQDQDPHFVRPVPSITNRLKSVIRLNSVTDLNTNFYYQIVCKYSKAEWSECDQATNTMTKTQTLTSGPSSCPAMKEFSRKCKKPCKFSQGRWSECDAETQQMTREDTLTKGNPGMCPPTRILTKKCGKKAKKCHYDHATWSECDGSEKPVRTRVQKLISGGENCEAKKITVKSCQKNSGKERCFFGSWSEYDDCKNGVQKKRRQVLQGGLDCERKSVKMKPC